MEEGIDRKYRVQTFSNFGKQTQSSRKCRLVGEPWSAKGLGSRPRVRDVSGSSVSLIEYEVSTVTAWSASSGDSTTEWVSSGGSVAVSLPFLVVDLLKYIV